MWRAASAPHPFFVNLDAEHPKLVRALGVALLSFEVGAVTLGVAFLRATGSNAYGPVLLVAVLLGVAQALSSVGVGGLLVQSLGRLDLRAYELVAWSWTSAFFTGVSLLPAAVLAPTLSAVVGLVMAVVWHLNLLRVGLEVAAGGRVKRTLLLYFVVAYGAPLAVGLYIFLGAFLTTAP